MTGPTLAHISDADLDRQIVATLREAAAAWPSVGAMVTTLAASQSPADRSLAAHVEAFLTGWRPSPKSPPR